MLDYKKYLQKLTVNEIKDIIKKYKLHTKIVMSGRKKDELIQDLMMHTTLKKSGIFLNQEQKDLTVDKKKHNKNIYNEFELEIVRRMAKSTALNDKFKEDLFKLNFDDPYYLEGREGNMPKKEKDEKAIKKLKEDIVKNKQDLKVALEDYRKFKLLS